MPLHNTTSPSWSESYTADHTTIRVSWQWSCQGVLELVRVHYQPEGGSLMMYTVGNTTATSTILPNLQCNTIYTVIERGKQVLLEWLLYQQEVYVHDIFM